MKDSVSSKCCHELKELSEIIIADFNNPKAMKLAKEEKADILALLATEWENPENAHKNTINN
eukprot:2970241-Ditylum_brightwellii.AAC.1